MVLLPLLFALGATAVAAAPAAPALAPRQSSCSITWNGSALTGYLDSQNVCRYTIRYGTAARWANAAAATSYGTNNALPPSCPQASAASGNPLTSATQSEDCLYITLYVPPDATSTDRQPILAWLHGGAYSFGSDSAAGFDPSNLAANGGIIVAAIQYRLGVLGNLPPSVAPLASDPNFAIRDVLLAIDTLRARELDFHGDKDLLTLGGQDSGASIIRALWGVDAAVDKFSAMILQSDPLMYGFASTATTASLRSHFAAQPALSGLTLTTFANWQALSLSTILTAQSTFVVTAGDSISGLPISGPLRPTWGTTTLPHDPTYSLFNNPSEMAIDPAAVPLLLTTTKHEAGSVVQFFWQSPVSLNATRYNLLLSSLVGSTRATSLLASGSPYALPTTDPSGDTMRATLEKTITDGAWRCPARSLANAYASAGGTRLRRRVDQGCQVPHQRCRRQFVLHQQHRVPQRRNLPPLPDRPQPQQHHASARGGGQPRLDRVHQRESSPRFHRLHLVYWRHRHQRPRHRQRHRRRLPFVLLGQHGPVGLADLHDLGIQDLFVSVVVSTV